MSKSLAGSLLIAVLFVVACLPFSQAFAPDAVPTATASPDRQVAPLPSATATPAPPTSIPFLVTIPASEYQGILPPLYAFIQAPDGVLEEPYVVLLGVQSFPGVSIEIRGYVNAGEFVCYGSPCKIPVPLSSQIIFRAFSSAGNSSDQVSATLRVVEVDGGYSIFVDSVSQSTSFVDSCLGIWDIQDYNDPDWAEFVQYPQQLNTNKTLYYLAAKLIFHGIVDVAGCPGGGLDNGLDWPTGCGLERARSAMLDWQNKYDEYIWLASKEVGIPPKVLKTLIEVESQFWPGDQRFYVDEIGLGQVNQLGVDVLLRTDEFTYKQACKGVLYDCDMPYTSLSDEDKALVRGALISSYSSVCTSCENGLDLDNSKQSIVFIARVLRANCETIKLVIDNHMEPVYYDTWEDPYPDLWKLTLFSYHSGLSCFEDAIKVASNFNVPMTWDNVKGYIDCESGQKYVDGVWSNLVTFDAYSYNATGQQVVDVSPVFAPTRTPFPTPILSSGEVVVTVYLDANRDGVLDESERLDNMPVEVQASNGVTLRAVTRNGEAVIDLTGIPANIEAEVVLTGLYRSKTITIPVQGRVPVEFIFDQPTLPTAIP